MFDPSQYQGDFRLVVNAIVPVSGSWVQGVGANTNRTILYITSCPNLATYLMPLGYSVSGPPTIIVPANATYTLSWYRDGFLPTLAWQFQCEPGSPNSNITFSEVLYYPGGE